MKNKKLVVPGMALLLMLAPALANADRIYYLIGVRHVYEIGPNKYANVGVRQNIEENYADGVAADEATYQQHVSAGADPYQESAALNADLDRLAIQRDQQLGSIYQRRDDLRVGHPQLRLSGDGPYQVIGIDYYMNGSIEVFRNFIVYAPWPGYAYSGGYYGGWHYGVVYTPGIFFNLYSGWHSHWGGGRFYGGFYGHSGLVSFHPRGYVYKASGYHGNGTGGYGGGRARGGPSIQSFHSRPSGGFRRGGAVNQTRGGSFGNHAPRTAPHGSFGRPQPPTNHPVRSGGSFGRPSAPRPPASFGRPSAPRTGGSFGRPSAPHGGGSFGRPSAPHGGGSFGHARPQSSNRKRGH